MAEELEIKLSLSPEAAERAGQWLLAQAGVSDGGRKLLVNRYFDTPGGDLNAARVALRIRQAGDRFIQTLKTRGEFVDGAHRRQEWEWPVPGPELDLALLEGTPLDGQVALDALNPVFETNFERRILLLESGSTLVECALDQGSIVAGEYHRGLCELELELKQGDSTQLLAWARRLAEQVPVCLNLISKAEQGYALAGLHRPRPPSDAETWTSRVLHGLSRAWLSGECDAALAQDLNQAESDLSPQLVDEVAWLRSELASGATVSVLASETPRMGQLQLAMIGNGQ